MGKCQSRFCCTADQPENKSPKRARSEKSANLEMNSRNPNSERLWPYACRVDINHPSYFASKKLEEYKETATKLNKAERESRKEFLRQLHRTVWKDVNQRIMKAREVALARRNSEVNQGASTSTANPSCNIPSSDEWLLYYPCLFDSISCSEEDDDEENCSQSSAAGHAANLIKFKMFIRNQEPEERVRLPQKTGPIDRDVSKDP